MAYGIRYVSALSTPGGDGSTTGTAGADRAWTINELLTSKMSGAVEHRVLNDGIHTVTGNVTMAAGLSSASGRIPVIGWDRENARPFQRVYNSSGNVDWSGVPTIVINSGFNITNTTVKHLDFVGLYVSGFANTNLFSYNTNATSCVFDHCRIVNGSVGTSACCISLYSANFVLNSELYSSGGIGIRSSNSSAFENVIANCTIVCNNICAITTHRNYWFNNVMLGGNYGIMMTAANSTNPYYAYCAINNTIKAATGCFTVMENIALGSGMYVWSNNIAIDCIDFAAPVTSTFLPSTTGATFATYRSNNVLVNTGTGTLYGDAPNHNGIVVSGATSGFLNINTNYSPYLTTSGVLNNSRLNKNLGAAGSSFSQYVGEVQ